MPSKHSPSQSPCHLPPQGSGKSVSLHLACDAYILLRRVALSVTSSATRGAVPTIGLEAGFVGDLDGDLGDGAFATGEVVCTGSPIVAAATDCSEIRQAGDTGESRVRKG